MVDKIYFKKGYGVAAGIVVTVVKLAEKVNSEKSRSVFVHNK